MFEKLKMFGRAVKEVRAGQKAGRSREEILKKSVNSTLSDLMPGFDIDDLGNLDDTDIPDEVLEYFEEDASDYLYDRTALEAFEFTQTHLNILRKIRLGWDGAETGAAGVDPQQPFTGKSPLALMGEIFSLENEIDQARAYVETQWMLAHFFEHVEISPGTYAISNLSAADIRNQMQGYGRVNETSDLGLSEAGQVILSQDMIAILKQTQWDWSLKGSEDEGGWPGPAINPKRPYGDMSHFYPEMAAMLGWEMEKDDAGYYETGGAQEDKLQALHMTQLACAQAMLEHGTLAGFA